MPLPLLSPTTYGQAFTVGPRRTRLTAGAMTGVNLAWCHQAGTIIIAWPGAEPETHSFVDGDQFGIDPPAEVTIVDGTWSLHPC